MAVQLIPNQLVKLYKTETFNERNKKFHQDYRTYCQIVKQEQTTYFQLKTLPEGNQLLTNGEFTNNLSGWLTIGTWQWSAGQAQGIMGTSSILLFQSKILSTDTNYALTVNVAKFAGSAGVSLNLKAESGEVHAIEISRALYGTNPGEFTLYFNTGAYTYHIIGLTLTGDAGDLVYLEDVSLYKLTTPTVTLETCTGTNIKTIPVLDTGNGRLTYGVEWFGLDDDCYRLCITDTEDLNKNYLAEALALSTEGEDPIELEDGGFLNWM